MSTTTTDIYQLTSYPQNKANVCVFKTIAIKHTKRTGTVHVDLMTHATLYVLLLFLFIVYGLSLYNGTLCGSVVLVKGKCVTEVCTHPLCVYVCCHRSMRLSTSS